MRNGRLNIPGTTWCCARSGHVGEMRQSESTGRWTHGMHIHAKRCMALCEHTGGQWGSVEHHGEFEQLWSCYEVNVEQPQNVEDA